MDYWIFFPMMEYEQQLNLYLELILILAVDLVRKMKTKMMMTLKK